MARTLMCLPLCLILAPSYPADALPAANEPTDRVYVQRTSDSDGLPNPRKDIFGFLEACLKRYDEKVKGYTLSFYKQERTLGTLNPWETIEVSYQHQPHKVLFDWQEGMRSGGPMKALYVEGENKKNGTGKSQLLALPAPPLTGLGPQLRDPDSADSKKTGRYPLNEFGLKQAMMRVTEAWKSADKEKALHIDYPGLRRVQKVDNRLCYEIRRHSFARPEGDDGVTEVTIFIDSETLFQVGTIVKGKDGEMLGEYYFRNIQLNPTFAPEQFTKSMLKAKR